MSTNIFQIGRLGIEKARIISLDNRLRKRFHDRIISFTVPIISGSPTPEQIAQGIQSSSALIPDSTVTNNIIAEKSISGKNINLQALDSSTILHNPYLSLPSPSPDFISNLEYAKKEIYYTVEQLDIPNAIATLGNIFEGKLDMVDASIPIIDASIEIIDTIFWATTSRFANESITEIQLTQNPILSTNTTITQISNSPRCPTNTQYVTSEISSIVDSSTFTIKHIAEAVADLSYNYVLATIPVLAQANVEVNPYVNDIIQKQSIHDISLTIPLQYPFESTYNDYKTYSDASLIQIQSQFSLLDASFAGIISNAITSFDTAIRSIYSTDNSFNILTTNWDNSYNIFIMPNSINTYSIDPNIILSQTTTAITFLFDNSSNSPATTEYVQLVLAGSLSNDINLLEALLWIRTAIMNDASFSYNTIIQINELNTNVMVESGRIDEFANVNLTPKLETLREIQQHRVSSDNSLSQIILPVFDASIQFLERHNPFQLINYNLNPIDWNSKDLSLNRIQIKYDASYQPIDRRYTRIDGSMTTLSTFTDDSIPILEQKIQRIDVSTNYTVAAVSQSQLYYDILKYKTDSSLNRITSLCDNMDASNAEAVAGIQFINSAGVMLDNSMANTYLYIKESAQTRDGSLSLIENDSRFGITDDSLNLMFQYARTMNINTRQNLTTRMDYRQITDLSLVQGEISMKSMESKFGNLPIDASAASFMQKYKFTDESYNEAYVSVYRHLDLSGNEIHRLMATFDLSLLEQDDIIMKELDNLHYGVLSERCFLTDASIAIYLTTTNILSVIYAKLVEQTEKILRHDISFSEVNISELITSSYLYSILELPANVEVTSQPSNNTTIGNTQYYWDYLREKIQGNTNSTIGNFSESIGNIYIGNYINENITNIIGGLSAENFRLSQINEINTENLNADASLIFLQNTYSVKEDEIRQLELFYDWKTALDSSLSNLNQNMFIMESSLILSLAFFNSSVPSKPQQFNLIDASYSAFIRYSNTKFINYRQLNNSKKITLIFLNNITNNIKSNAYIYINNINSTTNDTYSTGINMLSNYHNLNENSDNRIKIIEPIIINGDSSLNLIQQEISGYFDSRIGVLDNETFWNLLSSIDNSLNRIDNSLNIINNIFTENRQIADASLVATYQYYDYMLLNIDQSLNEASVLLINETLLHINYIQDISSTWIANNINLNSVLELPSETTINTTNSIQTTPATTYYVNSRLSNVKNADIALNALFNFADQLTADPSFNETLQNNLEYIDASFIIYDSCFNPIIEIVDASMEYYLNESLILYSQYSSLSSNIENKYERIYFNDISINNLYEVYNILYQTLDATGVNIANNDDITNSIFEIFNAYDSNIEIFESSFNTYENSYVNLETIIATDMSASYNIENLLIINDSSINALEPEIYPRELATNTIFDLLAKPTNISAQSTNDSITVLYQAPLLADAMNILKYSIVGIPILGTSVTLSRDVSSNILTTTFTDLLQNSVYNFIVSAYTDYCISSTSEYTFGTTLNMPSEFTFTTITTNSIGLQVNSTILPFTNYNIYYKALTSDISVNTTSFSNNITLNGLESGRIYDVSINIQNAYGPSPWAGDKTSTDLVLPASLSVTDITSSEMTINFSTALVEQDCSYVLRTVPNVTEYVLSAGTVSYSITGLLDMTSYDIILDASNLYKTASINTNATTISIIP